MVPHVNSGMTRDLHVKTILYVTGKVPLVTELYVVSSERAE